MSSIGFAQFLVDTNSEHMAVSLEQPVAKLLKLLRLELALEISWIDFDQGLAICSHIFSLVYGSV
jgi:hypothetical protein